MALVVHFVPDPSKALAEMARVVRPGGWVATYVWDYSIGGSPSAPLAAAMKALSFDWSPPPGANATLLPALNNLWRSVGFDEIDTRVIRIPVTFADFGEFWGSLTAPVGSAGQAIAEMSSEKLALLRAGLQERATLMPDGCIAYEACANAIKGRKKTVTR